MAYDLVIRNGTVVDGSGLGSYRADVGVVGDRIAFVGRIRDRGAPRDRRRRPRRHARLHRRPHPHGRAGVLGRQREQLVLARRDDRGDGQLRLHARAGARRRNARSSCATSSGPRTSTRPRWPTASTGASRHSPSTSTRSTRLPKGINFAANIGHSRAAHVGDGRACVRGPTRTTTTSRLMTQQLADSIRAGAIGFTTSRSEHHETSDDRPVASRLASWDEVVRLVDVMGDLGAGIFEGADGGMMAPDPERRTRSLTRMRDLAATTRVPMTFGFVADPGRRAPARLPRRSARRPAGG